MIIVAYMMMLRRRQRYTVRYTSLALIRQANPPTSRLRRHLPFVLFFLAMLNLIIAASRPLSVANVPVGNTTIILAIDVSRSMCSTDVSPNRLLAAQSAARSFIQEKPPNTQIGIVAFSASAEILQLPIGDQEVLKDVLATMTTSAMTAIGSGILASLDAIAEVDPNVAPSKADDTTAIRPTRVPTNSNAPATYAPAIIVLLTDGSSNNGPVPAEAAQQAVERGIRVYTIGFGTWQGGELNCDATYGARDLIGSTGQFLGDKPAGGEAFDTVGFALDDETLKQISKMTGGMYYSAASAEELHKVLRSLPTSLHVRQEVTEIGELFAAGGALLAVIAITCSLRWNQLL